MSRPSAGYFCDHNAGAPVLPEVLERFVAVERDCPGNPASSHAAGRRARAVLEDARERIAAVFGLAAGDVLFVSGGTEAANLAVTGLGDPNLPVLLSPAEHPAVREPAERRGLHEWQVDADGATRVTEPSVPVGLVACVHAQSELGTLQPVEAAAALAGRLGLPLFVDAAQTLGRCPVAPVLALASAVALSPHKCGGLRGHGVLMGHGLQHQLRPLLVGGGQEFGLRPGTQSPALAAANAFAIERAAAETEVRAARMHAAREAFLGGLAASGAVHRLLTPRARSLPNTAMLHFPGIDGRNLLPTLDLAGVFASHGSACSSGSPMPPRILRAIGLDDETARACVRFSLGWSDDTRTSQDAGRHTGEVVRRRQQKI
ncbi:MAG: aminotransferase class V-fold PLP-dependent enzyme [Planctomycetes bacterium]|nr:aminotransferase class V-fold PLP-dependent enzyme [Planctomycetota bacterium]